MANYCCFKFRPINKYLIESLVHSVLYFPTRAKLNDPFDCNVDIMGAIDRAIRRVAGQEIELLRKFEADQESITRFDRGLESIGIGSFSLTAEETLLWAHYADDHKGVAFRYDFPEEFLNDEDKILGVSSVSYDNNAISDWLSKNIAKWRDDHKSFIIGLLKKVLTSKAPSWAYEQEARIVRLKAGALEIPRTSLTHIIFGLQTTPNDEVLIRNIVNRYYDGVKFGRAVRTEEDFGLGTQET